MVFSKRKLLNSVLGSLFALGAVATAHASIPGCSINSISTIPCALPVVIGSSGGNCSITNSMTYSLPPSQPTNLIIRARHPGINDSVSYSYYGNCMNFPSAPQRVNKQVTISMGDPLRLNIPYTGCSYQPLLAYYHAYAVKQGWTPAVIKSFMQEMQSYAKQYSELGIAVSVDTTLPCREANGQRISIQSQD